MNLTPTIFLLLFTLSVSAQKSTKPAPIVAVTKLTSNADSVQYALGAYVAQWINNNGLLITNPNLFLSGMDDQFKNKPHLLTDSVITKLVLNYQNSSIKEKGIKQEQQMFASLKDKPGVGMLPNGVRYIIITAGKGFHASEGDSLVLNLSAKLPDNKVVKDTYQTKKPFTASTNSFFLGLTLMKHF